MKTRLALTVFLLASGLWASGFTPDRRVPAPATRPYTAAVRVRAGPGGIGSGFLVGPDLMATAGHVVCGGDGVPYTNIEVDLGVKEGKPRHICRGVDVTLSSDRSRLEVEKIVDGGMDWALVRLDRPMGLVYGWVECEDATPKQLQSRAVELVGFGGLRDDSRPEFAELKAPFCCPGEVRDVGPNIVFHDCTSWPGTSGSGILARGGDGKMRLVAVNTAGVEVAGENQIQGFRTRYTKDLANIAVPSAKFVERYRELYKPDHTKLRKLWIRNKLRGDLRVSVRCRSILEDPKQPYTVTKWQTIGSQKRECVMDLDAGCAESEVYLALRDTEGKMVGPRATEEFEVEGKKELFLRKYIGNSEEYTATYP